MVLRNQLDALKPAGWIQLVEVEWIDLKNPHRLPELYKHSLMQEWSTKSFGMDINIAYKLENMLKNVGFINIQKVQFSHGYGALAHSQTQKDASAELYVECFRSIDAKMPPGTWFEGFNLLKPLLLFLHYFFVPLVPRAIQLLTGLCFKDGIPGVAKTPQEFHDFLDRLELEIKEFGYQPKLNFIFAQKPSNGVS